MSEPNVTLDFNNDLFARRVFDQFWQIFLAPELERRKREGKPIFPENIFAFQIIQGVDHENKVHINKQIDVYLTAKIGGAARRAGSLIAMNEIEEILDIKLSDKYADSGHATFIKFKGKWLFTFEFNYNKKRRYSHLVAANEFLVLSNYALENGIWHAFVENLFAAVELMSKVVLIEFPDKSVVQSKTHSRIKSKINQRKKVEAFGAEFAHLLNELSELRPSARYISKPLELGDEKAQQLYRQAAELFEILDDRNSAIARRPQTSESGV